jgi:HIP---CoA ligase
MEHLRGAEMMTTIPAAVMASAARWGTAEAVVDGEFRVTYEDLGRRIVAATKAMIASGVGPGDRVAIWAPNSLGWIIAALGAQSAGAALVPINTRWKGSEAAYVLAAAGVSLLCTSVGFADTNTVAMLNDDTTPLPHLRTIVLLEDSEDAGARTGDEVAVVRWERFQAAGIGSQTTTNGSAAAGCCQPTRATSCSPPAPRAAPRVW